MSLFKDLCFLFRGQTPTSIYPKFFASKIKYKKLKKRYRTEIAEFQSFIKKENFNQDWFSWNASVWLDIFDNYNLRSRPIRALEIGSFEGLSACFLLQQLPQAHLTCVDTWEGSDEHKGLDIIKSTENEFDRHVAPWRTRVHKVKGTSHAFFANTNNDLYFDFIYIDGSHHADDVIADALMGFERLQVGGVMIFDDYLWNYYPRASENPISAINSFLRITEGRHKVSFLNYQVVVIKTAIRSS